VETDYWKQGQLRNTGLVEHHMDFGFTQVKAVNLTNFHKWQERAGEIARW
jgi:hypothetical protein